MMHTFSGDDQRVGRAAHIYFLGMSRRFLELNISDWRALLVEEPDWLIVVSIFKLAHCTRLTVFKVSSLKFSLLARRLSWRSVTRLQIQLECYCKELQTAVSCEVDVFCSTTVCSSIVTAAVDHRAGRNHASCSFFNLPCGSPRCFSGGASRARCARRFARLGSCRR